MTGMAHPPTRNTLYVEQAELLNRDKYAGYQYHMRLRAVETASHARPGHFVHIRCDPSLPMRRPMSIMRSNATEQTIDILYKNQGRGTALLSACKVGDAIDLIGPIGRPFKLTGYKKRPLLLGGGVGIPPMFFLAEHIKKTTRDLQPFVIMGSEAPFPFKAHPSQIMLGEVPADVNACIPLLDNWGIVSRLASRQGRPGCFNGYITDLAGHWLERLHEDQRRQVEIFACGPLPMLKAVAQLAAQYDLPCQVSLEEYMACAVGGCAGCAVLIETDSGPAMQRVCVDGPVFEAQSVLQLHGE